MWRRAPTVRLESHYGERISRCYVERPGSVCALLAGAASRSPDAVAIVDGAVRRTYAELDAAAAAVAAGLAARGVLRGDRVALLLDNRREFVEAFFGILRVGAIAVPLNVRDQRPELEYLIGNADAKVLIHEAQLAERLPSVQDIPSVRHRISVGAVAPGSEPFESLAAGVAPSIGSIDEEATAVILYTSGTTGRPKGAMLTHLSIVTSTLNYEACWELAAGERAVMAVPVSHVTGLVAILLAMVRVGGATVLMRDFKAARFLALAAAERMTYTIMVPAMYNLCLLEAAFEHFNLNAWRIGGYGGAPMPPATIARLAATMPWLRLVNAYGATETTSPTTLMPPGEGVHQAHTVGRPVPTAEVWILDADGCEVPVGTSGDIWIRGSQLVSGYWRNEAATAAAFKDGFWNSGDIGAFTADGYLRLLDRRNDLINRGGYKVYSAELESVLMQHPQVAEAAVIAEPDAVLGQRTHAVVYLKGGPLAAAELRQFCAERVSEYKVPDFITFVAAPLPRNAAGKVIKRLLVGLSPATSAGNAGPP